jgi:hypothetical protein
MKFTRDGQVLLIVVASILAALLLAASGVFDSMKPHHTTFDNYAPYLEFAVAVLVLIMIPVNVRRINRKFDVDEMLEDYRQRKKKRP